MSYDLRIWSVSPISLPGDLLNSTDWNEDTGSWIHEAGRWQIVARPSDRVLPEDVPDDVNAILPGIAYLSELHLSPIHTGADGKRFLVRTAKSLAKGAYGVVEDPQDDTVTTPSGIKRFVSLPPSESASLLSLSWWTVQGALACHANASAVLDVFQLLFPDALPRRYGLYEPPQHVYAETGRPHLEEFLKTNLSNGVVWYPHPPVADVSIRVPPQVGWNYLGFRCARLDIEVDAELLRQPGWDAALRTVWERISRVVQPFYGDVRTLHGYTRSRGHYWHGSGTQQHPVKAWWWRGIPAEPAHAIVVGDPYRSLWPSLAAIAPDASGLVFVPTEDWSSSDDVCSFLEPPPDAVVQPVRDGQYPRVWPFAPRPSEG